MSYALSVAAYRGLVPHPWTPPRLLVDGHLRAAADGATYPVLNPATGERIGDAPAATDDDMDAAIAAARAALDRTDWSRDHALRADCLRRWHDALVEEGDSLRALLTAEAGVPVRFIQEQYAGPVAGLASPPTAAAEPGVTAVITPWSAPLRLLLERVGHALAAGGTVVAKPSAETPWVAAELGRIAADVLPPGVLNVVTTRDVDVTIGLTTDPRVDAVDFAGSAYVGSRVEHQAAGKRLALEVGGVRSRVVPDGAGFEEVVRTVSSALCAHAGQDASLVSRLVVPRARHDEAVAVAAAAMSAIGVGDPTDPATVCGPVISRVHRDRILRYLALAQSEGATFATGGGVVDRGGGFWVEPTVVSGLGPGSRVVGEEIFGPVLVVVPGVG